MHPTRKENMLLFSKEWAAKPYKYRLYFTPVSSLSEETPRVYRLIVRRKKVFDAFELGKVYTLTCKHVHIADYTQTDDFALSEKDYTRLLETRDLKFIEPRTAAELRAMHKPYFSMDKYYTFAETREILSYDLPLERRISITLLNGTFNMLAFLIPFALYFLILYLYVRKVLDAPGTMLGDTLNVPLIAVGTLPFIIFIMTVLYSLSEILMLNLDFSRWYTLKKYTLKWGGIRKSIYVENKDKSRLIRLGIITFSIFVFFVILSFILPAVV